jgi:hypothetical protein
MNVGLVFTVGQISATDGFVTFQKIRQFCLKIYIFEILKLKLNFPFWAVRSRSNGDRKTTGILTA